MWLSQPVPSRIGRASQWIVLTMRLLYHQRLPLLFNNTSQKTLQKEKRKRPLLQSPSMIVAPSCWVFHAHHKDVHIASLSQSSYDYWWILTIQLNPSSLFQHENSTPLLNTAFSTKKPSNRLFTTTTPKVRTNNNQYAPLRNLPSFLLPP